MSLFSTPIGRLAFLARYFLGGLVVGVGSVLLGFGNAAHNTGGGLLMTVCAGVIEIFGIIYLIRFAAFGRLISCGLSRWWSLLLFVPIVNFIFFFYLLFCPAGRFVKDVGSGEGTGHSINNSPPPHESDSDPIDPAFICLIATILFVLLVRFAIKPVLGSLSGQAALVGNGMVLAGFLSLVAAAILVWFPGPRCAWPPRRWPLVLVLLCSLFGVLGTLLSLGRGTPPAKAIRIVFQQYRERASADDAEGVWSVLDSRTKGFYSEVVDNARALPASGLAKLDYAQRLMVLLLRLELRKQELERLDAQAAFLLARKREWLHARDTEGAKDLAKISVIGPHAYAYVPGHPDTLTARFVLEGTEWKLDFGEDVPLVNEQLAKAKTKSRFSEREFLKAMLKRYSDATVDDRIFQGPIE